MFAVAYYIEFLEPDGQTTSSQKFQNFFVGQTRNFDGKSFAFAPFAISGDIGTQGAESGEAELIAPANLLVGSTLWDSVNSRYLLRVRTVLIVGTPPEELPGVPSWEELGLLACDIRVCDALTYADKVPGEDDSPALFTMRLSNPLNTVIGTSPTRRLRDDQVGALPSSGGITF
jgi:hypothetical protein